MAFMMAIASSFAFKTNNKDVEAGYYYDRFQEYCLQGTVNEYDCETYNTGDVCTIYDPNAPGNVPAYNSGTEFACFQFLRQIN